ncbi:hypothetical protein WKI68_42630 [Streptomyces sp. MS1.HAVA.3]|uniref:Uncharacterized protein n=1 Tax=Streptomyces caledonius TaxID=3134107 RepID=A0ABU8UER4_9ACTN
MLRDLDLVMAERAVVTPLNRRAAQLLTDEGFPAWSRAVTGVLAGQVFPDRRLREWTLLKVVTRGEPWSAEQLTEASDWCPRTAVQHLDGYEALYLLATAARGPGASATPPSSGCAAGPRSERTGCAGQESQVDPAHVSSHARPGLRVPLPGRVSA